MTAPRQLLPGKVYFVTRRCFQQQFLLRPRKLVNDIFAYTLALVLERTGVKLHAYCVMSNHYHLLVSDPDARLPEFHQQLDSLVGRALNALYGRKETFWKQGSYSAIPLETKEDIVAKAVYVLANPVSARLVKRARSWPGLWSAPETFGGRVQVERPAHFFAAKKEPPKALELAVPQGFESASEFRAAVESGLEAREAEVAAEPGGYLGVARVLKQSPYERPKEKKEEPTLNPKVAAKDKGLRIELIRRLKAFLSAYKDALKVWREGKVEAVFPAGTYLMRVAHGVQCAGAG
jgi:REP element-mobilizing transposase RayT